MRILEAIWAFVLGAGFSYIALLFVLTPKSVQWMMNFHVPQADEKRAKKDDDLKI